MQAFTYLRHHKSMPLLAKHRLSCACESPPPLLPTLTLRPPRRRFYRLQRHVAALVLLAFAAGPAAPPASAVQQSGSGSLPSLGDYWDLTAAAERRIGERIAASIYRDPDYVDDPVLSEYVQGIWQPLLQAARVRGELSAELDERFSWQFFLIRDRSVNAFALPGGYFGVHLGLIASVTSRDELAAVLGHEMSHVTQRHIARLMTQQSRQTPWLLAAMVLGILAASKSPSAANAAIVGGQALAIQNQLGFSRDMEREADRVGFGLMTDAGFESRGVASMFEKLQQASRLNDNGAFAYLRSHPLNTERIAEAQARVQLATSSAPAATAAQALTAAQGRLLQAMMAARARLLAAPGVDAQRAMVAQAQGRGLDTPAAAASSAVSRDPRDLRDLAAQQAGALYAGALAAAQLRDFAVARALLSTLKPRLSGHALANTAFVLLGVELDLMEGKVPAAAASADASLMRGLLTRAEVLVMGRALLAAQRPTEVVSRLQVWVAERPKDAAAWQLLSAAYTVQGEPVRAIRADAESRLAELDLPAALDRFKAAQGVMRNTPGQTDYVEGSIIDTRVRQTELWIKQQALQDKIDR